jgi:hypothetical protein
MSGDFLPCGEFIPQIFAYTDRAMQPGSSSRFASAVLYMFMDNFAWCTSFSVSGFPVTHFIKHSSGLAINLTDKLKYLNSR